MDLTNLNKDKKQQRRPAADLSTMVYGKVPPQAKELEMTVLGAIMNEKHALADVQDMLKSEKFYVEAHQIVYQAMMNLDGRSQPIDVLTVTEELRRMEKLEAIGGPQYVVQLSRSVVSSANIESHTRIILEKWMSRELIRAGGDMVAEGYEDSADPFDMLDKAEAALARIMDSNDRGKITPIAEATARSLQRIATLRARDSSMTGIPSEFEELDRVTHGWQDTDLIILAARPAVGKTALALNLIRNAALNPFRPTPVAFFSLEMSMGQIMERLISQESGVFLEDIKTGQLTEEQMGVIHKAAGRIAGAPIYLDDTPALNLFELRAKCRRLKNKHNVGFFLIDYLQLMSGSGEKGNREQEISTISRGLKALAKELQAPFMALSQLSRAVENRTDKTPQLSDLRESGAIEQDADMVMFLYRPEYYGVMADENGASTAGETHVKIAKHRNGSLDTVKLRALLHIQKFINMDKSDRPAAQPQSSWRPVKDFSQPSRNDDLEF